MRKPLAIAVLGLLLLAGAVPAAAEPPSTYQQIWRASGLYPRADRQPSSPLRATRQGVVLRPETFPRVEVNLETSLYVRRETLTLKKFWDGRLRMECFRQVRPDAFYVFTSAPRLGRVPGAERSYGLGVRFTF